MKRFLVLSWCALLTSFSFLHLFSQPLQPVCFNRIFSEDADLIAGLDKAYILPDGRIATLSYDDRYIGTYRKPPCAKYRLLSRDGTQVLVDQDLVWNDTNYGLESNDPLFLDKEGYLVTQIKGYSRFEKSTYQWIPHGR